jgi:hypothetical protein
MNITNTMCRLSYLTQEQIDSLVDAMPDDGFSNIVSSESFIGYSPSGNAGLWNEFNNSATKIISYKEMMQLLGKTMEFTKSDLKTGMFVKYRNGNVRLVLGGVITGEYWTSLLDFDNNLKNSEVKERDIMAVYEVAGGASITMYLNGESLRVIWERTEQTLAQKEMEELQAQISKLQEQAKVLQSKL